MLHPLGVHRAREQRARHESAQRRRKAQRVREQHHAEANAEGADEQRLVVHQRRGLVHQRWQQVDAEDEPQRQIQHQQRELHRQRSAGNALADGERREDYHHKNARDVLDDQRTEHKLGEALIAHAKLVEGLDDYRRRAHREHTAEEHAVHDAPAEQLPDAEADEQHTADLSERGDYRRAADLRQLVEVEFQTEAEHEHYDADLAPRADGRAVRNGEEKRHIRAYEEARDYVAKDKRLLYFFEYDSDDSGRQQHYCKVRYQFRQMHLYGVPPAIIQFPLSFYNLRRPR